MVAKGQKTTSWDERPARPIKECAKCANKFQPYCPGQIYCSPNCQKIAFKAIRNRASVLYRKNNPEKVRREKAKFDLRQYGMTLEQYEELCLLQDHKCLICCEIPKGGRGVLRKLVVDHNHSTGQIRGLLCANCNTAIGLLKENKFILLRAIEYLKGEGNGV